MDAYALQRALALCTVLGLAACGPPPPLPPDPPTGPIGYTADGRVLGVERAAPEDPASYVHIVVRPGDEEPIVVDLGPGWYLDERGLTFSPEDAVTVEGRRVVRAGQVTIIARRVSKGSNTVILRDENDRPLWETKDAD
jgi:hypothetical protein